MTKAVTICNMLPSTRPVLTHNLVGDVSLDRVYIGLCGTVGKDANVPALLMTVLVEIHLSYSVYN